MKLGKSKVYSLKDYKQREVNLLPPDFHRGARIKAGILMFVALCIVAVGAFAFYEYTVIRDTKALEEETIIKKAAIAKNQNTISKQNIIMSLDTRIALKEFLLDYVFTANRSLSEMIDLFESKLNGEVYLTSLTADSSTSLTVSASALSHEAVSYTINQLKLLSFEDGTKYFDTVTTNGIVRNEDEDGNVTYLFQLECKFGGGVE
ncbi:hypothetical protein EZV73_14505 [Acidaminobacter sp. JC074]|uniref:DUF3256 family protein n=1 Tax=Acidaminobacter sp. JC074 TaxID=2530199 RepID=UPI001F0EF227|nr:DUF3256 family protein [Acidaminobacter sp. JC074]MCH4888803.1 hypothetical protein [Acidaminobacter sp. JC074]